MLSALVKPNTLLFPPPSCCKPTYVEIAIQVTKVVETLLSFTRVSVTAQSKRFHIATPDSARLSHSPSLLLFSLVFCYCY